ncbi:MULTISPECIES: rod-binding protein [unclassified Pseudodesulfovibrio]|uniref:rod-binding protein n=1 Tax=unclassified Pseudodesulfovibrio TaxID=2661612 RepID=UPI000FEB796D|nr:MULTISPECIES: rod-binding protein [unclassified Pseudodesulfovibrio]MCJ2163183.1 rod-binding protein [Pseudodesulfovibrio sp. S3-i]RWU07171.1 flagellar biosynthesis protein FlgJ [Pseudodesulfovibrio sp. S3]
MISSNIDPKMAASVADTQDLARFKTQMDGLKRNLSGGGKDEQEQLKEACKSFEAVFIGKLWQQMKDSVPKEGYLHSKQEDSYMSMFDKEFSEKMADAGGIGLADMIYAQLSQRLKQTSDTTLSGGVEIKPLVPKPIALNPKSEAIPLSGKEEGMTLEDWGGSETVSISGGNRIEKATEASVSSGAEVRMSAPQRLNDMEVQSRLDELTRRLEAQRIRDGLLSGASVEKQVKGYKTGSSNGGNGIIGRKLAEIG